MCLCACVCVGSIYCQFHMKLPLYRVNHKYLYVITSNLKSCLLQLFVKSIIEFLSSSPFSLFSCFSRFLFTTLYTIAFSFALHTFYILPLSLFRTLARTYTHLLSAKFNQPFSITHAHSLNYSLLISVTIKLFPFQVFFIANHSARSGINFILLFLRFIFITLFPIMLASLPLLFRSFVHFIEVIIIRINFLCFSFLLSNRCWTFSLQFRNFSFLFNSKQRTARTRKKTKHKRNCLIDCKTLLCYIISYIMVQQHHNTLYTMVLLLLSHFFYCFFPIARSYYL